MITRVIAMEKRTETSAKNPSRELLAQEWRDLFRSHGEALSSVARILTEGPCSPAVLLVNAEAKIKDRDIPNPFKFRYAIRTVALTALGIPPLEECADGFELFDSGSAELVEFESWMAALPRPERSVVFLREMLGYSRRETALFLSIGDSRVDDLLQLGRSRLLLQGPVPFDRVKRYFQASASFAQEPSTRGALVNYA